MFDGTIACWTPTWPVQVKRTPRMKVSKFGDGYEQRALDGINAMTTVWGVTFDMRPADVLQDMDTFLEGCRGGAFTFLDPLSGDIVPVFCDEWQIDWTYKGREADYGTLTAEFRTANGVEIATGGIGLGLTYYVASDGSDGNDGLSMNAPLKTINRVNALTLYKGATIAFRGGDTFVGNLVAQRSDISYTSYGTGRATITHAINTDGILVKGKNNVSVTNLIVNGAGPLPLSNTGIGISIWTDAGETCSNAYVSGCRVTGNHRGIACSGTDIDSIISPHITGNEALNNDDGIFTYSIVVDDRTVLNPLIEYNYAHDNKRNGLKLGYCRNGYIQYNYLNANGSAASGTGPCGIILYDSDGTIVQFNEASNTIEDATLHDGIGIDIESALNIIVQYNYTHGNAACGFMVYSYQDGRSCDNIIVRHNISINDSVMTERPGSLRIGRDATGSSMNIIRYLCNTVIQTQANRYCFEWGPNAFLAGDPDGWVGSNILYRSGTGGGQSTGLTPPATITIQKNLMFGGTSYGTGTITSNPQFQSLITTAPTMGWNGWNPALLNGLRLLTGSPALNTGDSGLPIGTQDFFGNPIGAGAVNCGAYDGAGL